MLTIPYHVKLTPLFPDAPLSPPESSKTRIALVSDTHTNLVAAGELTKYRERLAKVIEAVNAASVDVVVLAGDLTENGTDEEFAEFQRQSAGFNAPLLTVPGNHDVGGKHLPGAPDAATTERIERYEAWFGTSFWRRQVGGIRFIGVNSLIFDSCLEREQQQWAFLEHKFAAPSSLPTILVLHQPLFLERTNEPGGDYWNVEPAPRARLLRLLAQGGVSAVLSGHIHRPLYFKGTRTVFVTTPPVSFGLPFGVQPEGWTLVTVTQGYPGTPAEVSAEAHTLRDESQISY
jgi:3',5'-cyclic AMP phosphodiesterase CpdA